MLVIGNLWIAVCSPVCSFVRFEMHVLLLRNIITEKKIQEKPTVVSFSVNSQKSKVIVLLCTLPTLCTPERVQQTFIQETSSSLSVHLSSFLLLKSIFRNQAAELLFTNEVLLVSSEDSQLNYLSLIEFYAYYSQDNFLLLSVTPIQNF